MEPLILAIEGGDAVDRAVVDGACQLAGKHRAVAGQIAFPFVVAGRGFGADGFQVHRHVGQRQLQRPHRRRGGASGIANGRLVVLHRREQGLHFPTLGVRRLGFDEFAAPQIVDLAGALGELARQVLEAFALRRFE